MENLKNMEKKSVFTRPVDSGILKYLLLVFVISKYLLYVIVTYVNHLAALLIC